MNPTVHLTIIEKVNDKLKKDGIKSVWLAEFLGISKSYLSNILNCRVEPTKELQEKLQSFLTPKK